MKYALFFRRSAHLAALFGSFLVLTACGEKANSPAHTGQWVAKVNGQEITIHQVNVELNNAGPAVAGMPAEVAQRRVVETIVERQLLVDAAVKAKQDREPDVIQAIEQAKQQIIAQAYLRKTLGSHLAPSQDDISEYYNKNPDLFAKRKQFEMRQLSVDSTAFNDALAQAVDSAKSIDDVETSFSAKNVKFVKGRILRTSTDLPPQMRESMDKLLGGKPFVIHNGPNVIVATMSVIGEAPLSLQEAAPQIAQYLANTRGRDATAAEIARLRKDAHIEYQTGYGPAAPDASKTASNETSSAVDRAAAGLR
jgi:EpsD family peptidyl-prolyl cis-trans isomerase